MIISFPVLISETVDMDIIPYLLKAIERRFALSYIPTLQKIIQKEMDANSNHLESKQLEAIILEGEDFDHTKLMEGMTSGIQIMTSDSNKLNSDQPFFITLRVTTDTRITQDYVFGFKSLALVTSNAFSIFETEMDESRYFIYRTARKLFGDAFYWKMITWYKKVFDKESTKTQEFITQKVLFAENQERIVVLSTNDLDKEKFQYADPDKTPLSSKVLEDSRWSSLYLDDKLNKRIYVWNQEMPSFASIITYDMLYKNTLNVIPEEMAKAKQKDVYSYSKRVPMNWALEKILGKVK